MKPLVALLLLPAGGASAQAVPAPLPGRAEAAAAFFEWEADVCRASIDVCDFALFPPPPERIGALACRSGRDGAAACSFEVNRYRCRAHFISAAAGADHAWAMAWSNLPAAADIAWAVAWTAPPRPRGPRVRCRAID